MNKSKTNKYILRRVFVIVLCIAVCSNTFSETKCFNSIYFISKGDRERKVKNIVALIRLYGYIKYFHPSDQAVSADWPVFFYNSISPVLNAKNDQELASDLFSVFSTIAPSVKIIYNHKDSLKIVNNDIANRNDKKLKIIFWRHCTDGIDKRHLPLVEKLLMSGNTSELVKQPYSALLLSDSLPNPDRSFVTTLSDSIECIIPIALFCDNKGTFPHIAKAKQKTKSKYTFDIKNENDQLFTLANAWNIIQHFYPCYDESGLKDTWDKALIEGLDEVLSGENEKEFATTLRELLAKTNDCHSRVGKISSGFYIVPHTLNSIVLDLIENNVIITKINDKKITTLKEGDVITAINDENVNSLLEKEAQLVPASRKEYKYRQAAHSLISSTEKDSVLLQVNDSSGKSISVTLNRFYKNTKTVNADALGLHEITFNKYRYFYVNLWYLKLTAFKRNIDKINASDGLIIDLREYPNQNAYKVLSYLTKEIIYSGNWYRTVTYFPNHFLVQYVRVNPWIIKPAEKQLTIPKVVLSSYDSYSYSESLLEIIKHYNLAPIIGENSAGTNGDIVFSSINDKYLITWTGLKVLNRDGTYFHGVGIAPDVLVNKTIAGIRANKDEVLDAAINYLTVHK